MAEFASEIAQRSSATPGESRQAYFSEGNTQATPQPNGKSPSLTQPEPEPVPSTSGINSKGKRLADLKSRLHRKRKENLEDSIVSAFKFIKISGEWNEDDSSDDDYAEEEKKREAEKKKSNFDQKEDESAILELAIDSRDTYPQVYDVEDEPRPSTSISFPLETGTVENEPQPVSEENLMESDACAQAHFPASPPPKPPNASPLSENVMSSLPFHKLGLPKEMIQNLRESLGITMATILQEKAIPILMQEKDAFMHAAPGSGKTVAYTIPVIHHLSLIKPQVCCEDGIRVLVVVPNKECAIKTYQTFTAMVRLTPWLVIGLFGGGDHFRTERELIKRGAIILITTPARFLDHVRRTSNLFLKNLSSLLMDGLDQVFEQGGEKQLSDIITVVEKGVDYLHHPEHVNSHKKEHVEASRQTIFISSSITEQVARFTGRNTTKPMLIDDKAGSPPRLINIPVADPEAKHVKLPPPLINQHFMIVPERMKLVALIGFALWKFRVAHERRILVFAGTQTMVDYFYDLFLLAYGKTDPELEEEEENPKHFAGMDVFKLTPFMNQKDIVSSFMTFTRSKCGILFCTDSTVMGVDLPRVDWVVHLHAPTCTSSYLARIGMANPGLQIGSSLSLLLPSEKGYVQELKNHDIPLTSIKLRQSFRNLWAFYPPSHTIDDMIFEIQTNIEDIVHLSPRMHEKACLAFASWCRLYSSYPENLKHIFRFNSVHVDNYLHSFGLRGQSSFAMHQARKLHTDTRRRARKRSAPGGDAESPQESPTTLPPLPMPPPDWAQVPTQAAAPAPAPTGTEESEMSALVEALTVTCAEDLSESKKRKNDEMMWVSDDEEATPEKRFRLRGGKWHLRGCSIFSGSSGWNESGTASQNEDGRERE